MLSIKTNIIALFLIILHCAGHGDFSFASDAIVCDSTHTGQGSTYTETIEPPDGPPKDRMRGIVASGCPNHPITILNPNEAIKLNKSIQIPAKPCISDQGPVNVRCVPDSIGIFLNGVSLYGRFAPADVEFECDANSGWQYDAVLLESNTFDSCSGHGDFVSQYHYHVAPACLLDQLSDVRDVTTHSPRIGWAYDGFPVYGPHGIGGKDMLRCNHSSNIHDGDCLDECNGHSQHNRDGFKYHYHVTGPIGDRVSNPLCEVPTDDMAPYTIGCLVGIPHEIPSLPSADYSCSDAGSGTTAKYNTTAQDGVTTPFNPTPAPTQSPFETDINLKNRPNIIYIMFDDLGFVDVGYNGGDYPTPILDNYANAEGTIKFNFHYTEQICSPTRSALHTGRYAWKTGLNHIAGLLRNTQFLKRLTTFPELLAEQRNYNTHFTGKWHMGYQDMNHLPYKRGYTAGLYRHLSGGYYSLGQYPKFERLDADYPISISEKQRRNALFDGPPRLRIHDLYEIQSGEEIPVHMDKYTDPSTIPYSDELYSEHTKEFIRAQGPMQPFFSILNYYTPHASLEEPPLKYKKNKVETDIDYGLCKNYMPAYRPELEAQKILFCKQMYYVQLQIEDIIETLKTEFHYDDTVIIIASDNGPSPDVASSDNQEPLGFGETVPLRGVKSGAHEGAIRTPAIMFGGWVEDQLTNIGSSKCEYDSLFHVSDWYHVFMDMVGIDNEVVDAYAPDQHHAHLDMWHDIKCKCSNELDQIDGEQCSSATGRKELMQVQRCNTGNDAFYYSSYIIREIDGINWKLAINASNSLNDYCDALPHVTDIRHTSGYQLRDAFLFTWPDQDYFNGLYMPQFFPPNLKRANKLFYSQCLKDLVDAAVPDRIAYDETLFGYSDLMLFKLSEDLVEACNVATDYSTMVTDLFQALRAASKQKRYNIPQDAPPPSQGAFLAQMQSYDCTYGVTYTKPWNGKKENACRYKITPNHCDSVWSKLNDIKESCSALSTGTEHVITAEGAIVLEEYPESDSDASNSEEEDENIMNALFVSNVIDDNNINGEDDHVFYDNNITIKLSSSIWLNSCVIFGVCLVVNIMLFYCHYKQQNKVSFNEDALPTVGIQ